MKTDETIGFLVPDFISALIGVHPRYNSFFNSVFNPWQIEQVIHVRILSLVAAESAGSRRRRGRRCRQSDGAHIVRAGKHRLGPPTSRRGHFGPMRGDFAYSGLPYQPNRCGHPSGWVVLVWTLIRSAPTGHSKTKSRGWQSRNQRACRWQFMRALLFAWLGPFETRASGGESQFRRVHPFDSHPRSMAPIPSQRDLDTP